jgi:hypothetical protein
MKFVEELKPGECFSYENNYFIISSDFKKSKEGILKSCIEIKTGLSKWIKDNTTVEIIPLFTLDLESNIIPIRETEKENA